MWIVSRYILEKELPQSISDGSEADREKKGSRVLILCVWLKKTGERWSHFGDRDD